MTSINLYHTYGAAPFSFLCPNFSSTSTQPKIVGVLRAYSPTIFSLYTHSLDFIYSHGLKHNLYGYSFQMSTCKPVFGNPNSNFSNLIFLRLISWLILPSRLFFHPVFSSSVNKLHCHLAAQPRNLWINSQWPLLCHFHFQSIKSCQSTC